MHFDHLNPRPDDGTVLRDGSSGQGLEGRWGRPLGGDLLYRDRQLLRIRQRRPIRHFPLGPLGRRAGGRLAAPGFRVRDRLGRGGGEPLAATSCDASLPARATSMSTVEQLTSSITCARCLLTPRHEAPDSNARSMRSLTGATLAWRRSLRERYAALVLPVLHPVDDPAFSGPAAHRPDCDCHTPSRFDLLPLLGRHSLAHALQPQRHQALRPLPLRGGRFGDPTGSPPWPARSRATARVAEDNHVTQLQAHADGADLTHRTAADIGRYRLATATAYGGLHDTKRTQTQTLHQLPLC